MKIYRLSFQLAANMIGYTDLRAFKNWCENYGVRIFQDPGSRIRYVFINEFEYAANHQIEKYVQKKYGHSPEEIASTLKMRSEILSVQDKSQKQPTQDKNYHSKQKHELNFLSRLTNTLNKTNNTK